MKRNTLGMFLASIALATTAGCSAPGPMDSSSAKMTPPVVSPPDPPVAMKTLAVTPVGNGGGSIVSDPAGIQCPGTCAAQFPVGTLVTLTAKPDAGATFEIWNQACVGTDPLCLITMSDDENISFSFRSGASGCASPQVQCGGQCVDTTSDANHCGDCNTACGAGESCQAAACVAPACPSPSLQCGAQCVDPSADSANCGGCSIACGASQACVASACVSSGKLLFSATWSRAGDGNLLVTTPTGNTIWANNLGPSSTTDFGQMDHDDTTGNGPENIYWDMGVTPPSGTYYVCFELNFASPPSAANPVQATISVNLPGQAAQMMQASFIAQTSSNGVCNPALDTFITSINYP